MRENKKIIIRFILTFFFLSVGYYFLKYEKPELYEVKQVLLTSKWPWLLGGGVLTILYFLLQGLMYVFSFSAIQQKVSLLDSIILFAKRNFVSVFLPAGGISSLGFYTEAIENKGINKTQIHFASTLYGFTGILSVVLVAIPAFLFSLLEGAIGLGEWTALIALLILIIFFFLLYRSVMSKGIIYQYLTKLFPATEIFFEDLRINKVDPRQYLYSVGVSVLIEVVGIATVYVAMLALDFTPSLYASVMGYLISVVFLSVSPFLRGLGAIEISMTLVLVHLGFGKAESIAITLLYRFFEFWVPLLLGLLVFLSGLNKILMRILPAFFVLGLGITNIISVATPALAERLALLSKFLPDYLIHASNQLVLVSGLLLLVTATFLLKGLRSAWWLALFLSVISLISHLTKGIDYEETTVAFFGIIILMATHKEYYVKSNPKLRNVGLQTSVILMVAILAYGIIGFYFIDKNHFNIDFSLWQSFVYTSQAFFFIGSPDLVPNSQFAKYFLYSINFSGFVSIAFLIYTIIKRYVPQENITGEEMTLANDLVRDYGKSALDYFKIAEDKILYFSTSKRAFIAYRISGSFAVVLEDPVAENQEEMTKCISEFNLYCYENGLKCIYYRVPEESLKIYSAIRLKALPIGQEGVIDLTTFTLDGSDKRSLRNAINKVPAKGNKAVVYNPPLKDGTLQKLKSVSDEWLKDMERDEIVFSQGLFDWDELKNQTIIAIENNEEKIIAFLNIIPDYAKNEATYDLVRKTKDAPNGVLDYLLVELIKYTKTCGYNYVNIGFAPLSGLSDPKSFPERSMGFAYEKIKSFSQYRGLREYKEKFDPVWYNKYLIYQQDYDLLQIPSVLVKVIKP